MLELNILVERRVTEREWLMGDSKADINMHVYIKEERIEKDKRGYWRDDVAFMLRFLGKSKD